MREVERSDELLTTRQVCSILNCGLTQLYSFVSSGKLESVKLGKSRRIQRSALNRFIANLSSNGTEV